MPDFAVGCISDLHIPIHNQKSIDWALGELKGFGIGQKGSVLVINGDLFEGKCGSRHSPDERHSWTVSQEFHEVEKFLKGINEGFPDAYKVFLFGNHDDNLINYNAGRLPKELQQLVFDRWQSVKKDLLSDWRVIDQYTHETNWYLGQLCFRHGCDTSKAGLVKDLFDYGVPNGLLVEGHKHRVQDVTQLVVNDVKAPYWSCNTGTLADIPKMHYMDRSRKSNWGAGVLLAECKAPGLKEGRKSYEKPCWKGTVKQMSSRSQHGHDVRLHV